MDAMLKTANEVAELQYDLPCPDEDDCKVGMPEDQFARLRQALKAKMEKRNNENN